MNNFNQNQKPKTKMKNQIKNKPIFSEWERFKLNSTIERLSQSANIALSFENESKEYMFASCCGALEAMIGEAKIILEVIIDKNEEKKEILKSVYERIVDAKEKHINLPEEFLQFTNDDHFRKYAFRFALTSNNLFEISQELKTIVK